MTEARPSKESWPLHTHLEMTVTLNCAVLHSLSEGHWPATALKLITNGRAEPVTTAEVQELAKWDLTTLDTLSISGLGIGYADNVHVTVEVLCRANWPKLRSLDISFNSMGDALVQGLIGGNWPLLQTLSLFGNLISGCGVQQLIGADWPCLSEVQLGPYTGQGIRTHVENLLRARWPVISVCCDAYQKGFCSARALWERRSG